jgi:hypothetical protein
MNRRAFLNGAAWDPRQPVTRALRISHLPDFVGTAAGQTGAPVGALRLGHPSAQQAQPSASFPMTDPADLVARALQILAEENDAWQERRSLDRAPRSTR